MEVVEVVAPTGSGATVALYNAYRVDTKAHALDQEPFVVVVHASGTSTAGHFIHHGDWEGRTTPFEIPGDLRGEVTAVTGVIGFGSAEVGDGATNQDLSSRSCAIACIKLGISSCMATELAYRPSRPGLDPPAPPCRA